LHFYGCIMHQVYDKIGNILYGIINALKQKPKNKGPQKGNKLYGILHACNMASYWTNNVQSPLISLSEILLHISVRKRIYWYHTRYLDPTLFDQSKLENLEADVARAICAVPHLFVNNSSLFLYFHKNVWTWTIQRLMTCKEIFYQ
jgi:uncharacterized membrane protein